MFSEFSEMKEFNNDKRSERPHILGGEITQLQHMTGEKSIRIVKILKIRIVKMNEKNGNTSFRHFDASKAMLTGRLCH